MYQLNNRTFNRNKKIRMQYNSKYKSYRNQPKLYSTQNCYQSPKHQKIKRYENQTSSFYSTFDDLQKSSYSRTSKHDYNQSSYFNKTNNSSILRNTTHSRPLLDYNRGQYVSSRGKKNITFNEELEKSKYSYTGLEQSSILLENKKKQKPRGLNSYLSQKQFSVQRMDDSYVSPYKKKSNYEKAYQSNTNYLQSSKYRQNQRSRKKLLDKYNEFIGSKSVNNIEFTTRNQKPSHQKYQSSKPYFKPDKQTSSINKRQNYQKYYNQNKSKNEYKKYEEQKQNSIFSKSKIEVEQYRSLQKSQVNKNKPKSSQFATSKTNLDISKQDRYFTPITSIKQLKTTTLIQKPTDISIYDFNIGNSKGQGKFGTVYPAIHKATGSLYALKKISKQAIKSHMMQNQLVLQIKLQLFFNHPNILKLYGCFDDKDYIYLILEYMQQGTLFESLRKRKDRMPQKEVIQRIRQMSHAIKYLHQIDVAHRDIKPQNIVISNGISKLCDFGWATICNDRRKTYCGTFDYAAPEILEGKQYDWCVDLWCLGVLTYQLLVGKVPFYHISRKQTMKKILRVDQDQLTFPNDVSWKAKDFIQSLIKKDPEERMTSEKLLEHPFLKQPSI